MHKLVIDLEMADRYTKEYQGKIKFIHEIIQVGAVLLDDDNTEINRYETLVKPQYSTIRKKITDLTGITNDMVKDAPHIDGAIQGLLDILVDADNTIICTWSDSDTKAILKEMELKGLHNAIISKLCETYYDIQTEFDNKVGFDKQVSLTNALELVGIDFEGRAHGALADAINTAKLYKEINENDNIKEILHNISDTMKTEPLTASLGSLFDFSQLSLN